jgi:hypothetical protein
MTQDPSPGLSRRRFLRTAAATSAAAGASGAFADVLHFLTPLHVANPLAEYPNRDWEKAYRNIFRADSSFVFLCAPNDTHNCLLAPTSRTASSSASAPPSATARRPTSTATALRTAGIRASARRAWRSCGASTVTAG